MNQNTMFLFAAVGAAYVMAKKEADKKARAAAAAKAPSQSNSPSPVTTNVNNQLWSKVLGGAWNALVEKGSSTDGAPFLMRNDIGQVVTSDGKPVNSIYSDITGALSGGVDTSEASGGVDYLGGMGW